MKTLLPMRQQLKVIFLIVLFWMSSGVLLAQNPLVKQWDKRFGGTGHDYLTCFQQSTDGGYVLGGHCWSGIGGDKTQPNWDLSGVSDDYWIVKLDSMGIKQWDKDFGGTNDDYLYSLQQTTDRGYILGGWSSSDSNGNKTQASWGGADFWVVKIDSLGNKQWDKDFGGLSTDELYSLQQTADGGYILGGKSNSHMSGNKTQNTWFNSWDYWIVKIDSLGNKQWDKDFGGAGIDMLYSLQQTVDGGYIIGGVSNSVIFGDKTQTTWGGYDYWIVKIDSLGNKQWDKDFGGTGDDALHSLLQTTDGGYILAGRSGSDISGNKTQITYGGYDYWIIKIDLLGNKQWDKDFGGTAQEDEFGNVTQTSDGGYLIAGTSYSPISGNKTEANLGMEQTWVIKIDSMGNLKWDKTLLNSDHNETGLAIQTKDECFAMANWNAGIIGGYKTQPSWGNSQDYWIIKFCDTTLTSSINENLTSNLQLPISIAPNPNDGSFTISFNEMLHKDFSLRIINTLGQTILKKQEAIVNGLSPKVSLSNATKGLYVVEVTNDSKVYRTRFIMQ